MLRASALDHSARHWQGFAGFAHTVRQTRSRSSTEDGLAAVTGHRPRRTWRTELSPIRSATIAALASAVLATTLTGCQFGGAQQDTSPIVIAADLELSGASAPVGKAYQRALELKVEQLNASGALGGRKIELKVKDNRSDAAESLAQHRRLQQRLTGQRHHHGRLQRMRRRRGPHDQREADSDHRAGRRPARSPARSPSGGTCSSSAPNAADSAAALTAELGRQQHPQGRRCCTATTTTARKGSTALRRELSKANIKLPASESVQDHRHRRQPAGPAS